MLQPGESIDIWVVESALGSGGMGSVYRCHNRSASRILAAIKVLEGGLNRYPEAEARFVREAEILFQLDHPNIVKVRNIRTETDPPYLEMEFVAGEPLDERLHRGSMAFRECLEIMKQVAAALTYLHERGIRHRDIKPANVLVQADGRVKLVDFGLAVEADHSRITQQGIAFGTVSYAPPEWIAPETMDPVRWDVYAMGVVFYEMLTGQLAFPVSGHGTARQQAMQVIVAKQGHAPLDPGDAYHDDVRKLIADMTSADANLRIGEVSEVSRRLATLRTEPRRALGATLAPNNPFDPHTFEGETDSVLQTSSGTHTRPQPPRPQPAIPSPRTVRLAPFALAFGGVGAFLVGMLAVVGFGGAGLWWVTRPPLARPVRVATALPPEAPVDVALSTGRAAGRQADGAFLFDEAEPGAARIVWAAGPGCYADVCANGACPAWCTHGEEPVDVRPGSDPQVVQIGARLPQPRKVEFGLPLIAGAGAAGVLGTEPAERTPAGVSFSDITPGTYTLSVVVDGCPPSATACRWERSVTVPVAGPPDPQMVLVHPAGLETRPVPAATSGQESEPPRPAGPRGAPLVTNERLERWIGGDAERGHGWTRTAGASDGAPARGAAPGLARLYCDAHGGIAGAAAAPQTDAAGLEYEIRRAPEGGRTTEVFVQEVEGQVQSYPAEAWRPIRNAVFRCAR